MNVEEMYQQIILDHYREKHHSGLRENYDAEVTQVNPSCGDELLPVSYTHLTLPTSDLV